MAVVLNAFPVEKNGHIAVFAIKVVYCEKDVLTLIIPKCVVYLKKNLLSQIAKIVSPLQ